MLERIAGSKQQEVQELLAHVNTDIIPAVKSGVLSSFLADKSGRVQVIAEIKKASPVKGVLRKILDPAGLAQTYKNNGAAIISVITDNLFFHGDKEYVKLVKESTGLPVLRKDFIIHEIQLYETVLLGADAVLLIAGLHDYRSLLRLSEKCRELGLEPLVEVHDRGELQKSMDLPVRMLGINNRNLKTFLVDITTSIELGKYVPPHFVKISESGIKSAADMRLLESSGFQAALVGEALVTSADPGCKLKELVAYSGDD